MKSMFIMSVMGPDNPGTMKSVAEVTREIGGEWLRSKVMRLDGQLTALMKVAVDAEKTDLLQSELRRQFADLQISYSPVTDPREGATKSITLVVDCQDRPGLTKELSRVLANLDLVVENMECNRVHISSIGQAAFTARVSLSVPENMEGETVADEIEALAEDMRVTVV
jgi:glycine cleavage system regulatory protein